jgi:sortase A
MGVPSRLSSRPSIIRAENEECRGENRVEVGGELVIRHRSSGTSRKVIGVLASLIILAGLLLVGYSLLVRDPLAVSALFGPEAPENPAMTLTVPTMDRVEDVPVYNGPASDKKALHDGTLHLEDTGFPWQQGSNVYIAGHRLGFPATKSYLVFWDLDELRNGDEVVVTDANGTRYTYAVFEKFVVAPDAYHVTQPVPGRSIISLQTCTLPDYSQRLVVQAELTSVS